MGDKRVRRGKLFRRKMWAVVGGSYDWLVYYTYERARECAADNGGTLMSVSVTEIRKAGAKRGRGK